ncbi:MAG TPA: hypothetical protein VJ476_02835 [Rhizomicrobium sp.]|nr:hypothetical protein [Rhizomicrobium sp.]
MAQFTLKIRNGDEVIYDGQIYHFATAQDARDATVRALRKMIAERDEDFDSSEIEIADATGHAISVVRHFDVMPARFH